MTSAERVSARLVALTSQGYLWSHRRAPYRLITPYRLLVRTLGRSLLRRALALPPLPLPTAARGDVCLHLLTKANECLFALWACRSLLAALDRPTPVFVHDDGSLTYRHVQWLEESLPGIQVVRRADGDALARRHLAHRPNCSRLRDTNNLSLKLFDPWIVQESGDIILLDSDVLFFRRPAEIVRWLDRPAGRRNAWNHGAPEPRQDAAFLLQLEALTGVRVPSGLNTGIGLVTRASVSFDTVEELLRVPAIAQHPWLAEQRLYALLSAIAGTDALPPTYRVADFGRAGPETLTAKHYVGTHRGLFIAEGLSWILERQSQATRGSLGLLGDAGDRR